MERTLVIVKPDGVQRGLTGQIIARFERKGLRIVGMKFIQMDVDLASRHYAVHEGKPFYYDLIQYITSGPVLVMALEGNNAIAAARNIMGGTNPTEATPGSIRGDFGMDIGRNLVHGSDGPDTASFELGLYFDASELVAWERSVEEWVFE